MANSKLTVNEKVRKLNQEQQAIYRKLRRLAPAGTIEYVGTTDGTLLTWQSTWEAVANAAACLDDLAGDSIIDDLAQAEKKLAATSMAAVEPQVAGSSLFEGMRRHVEDEATNGYSPMLNDMARSNQTLKPRSKGSSTSWQDASE